MAISIAAIIFGILTGSLLSVLVGLVGSRRRIGFGWTFLLSIIFTPLIGLNTDLPRHNNVGRDHVVRTHTDLTAAIHVRRICGLNHPDPARTNQAIHIHATKTGGHKSACPPASVFRNFSIQIPFRPSRCRHAARDGTIPVGCPTYQHSIFPVSISPATSSRRNSGLRP